MIDEDGDGAAVEHRQYAGGDQRDHQAGGGHPGADEAARGGEGALQGLAVLAGDGPLLTKGQHGLQALQPLAGAADGLGEAILRQARQAPEAPAREE